ncbi:hypothetical protein [Sphingobium yanoikuyae]|uniref:hypothetical protein n=1 Tax=Sphingobium yanoikuyae TaxID=13690 RepID=UPI0028A5B36B|nr:hypothetical protein [Sphingobium yanoikuyae]
MAIFYSADRNGFFDDAIHADLPTDAQPITAGRHRELLDAQAAGATIEAGDNGKPRFRRPSADARRAALLRLVKREAARRIAAVSPIWRQLNDQRAPTTDGEARFAMIDAIRAASDRIEAQVAALDGAALASFALVSHPFWPES